MSSGDHESEESVGTIDGPAAAVAETEGAEPKRKLQIDVQIQDAGACRKHIKVTIPREEIERQFEDSLGNFQRDAHIPGFRPGKAPRQLVVKRFRKEVSEQVKSSLVMGSLEQIDADYDLHPITNPDLDLEAVQLPDGGPMSFEMDVEVRPDFAVPDFSGLKIQRPVREITEADVDQQEQIYLEQFARIVPKLEGGAELGDHVTADLTFLDGDRVLNETREHEFRLTPELRFKDGRIPEIGAALVGAKPGDVRDADAEIGLSAPEPSIRGRKITIRFKIKDLKRAESSEFTPAILESLGFSTREGLRTGFKEMLERRWRNQQQESIRRQLLDALLARTPFDLPRDLVARQEKDTLRSMIQDLRRQGISESEVRARGAQLRANVHQVTQRSLQEFFLLAKIADVEKISVDESDLEVELEAIAERTGESVRRVRSRLEKEEAAEPLSLRILERKVLDHILQHVEIEDVVETGPDAHANVETLDDSASASGDVAPEDAEGADEGETAAAVE